MNTPKTDGFSNGAGPMDVIFMDEHLGYMRDGLNERKAMQKQIDSYGLELLEIKKILKEYLSFSSIDGRFERQGLREKLKSFI